MKLSELFIEQLDLEAPISRRQLERVPEGRDDWKPHEKSMPLGYLANLVATMPSWMTMAVRQDQLDLKPPGGGGYEPPDTRKKADLLRAHEEAVAGARAALAGADDDFLRTRWKLLVAGRVVSEDARYTVINATFTHLAHHRGQLTVYLRLLGVSLPSVYGPTADERTFG